MKNFKEAFTEYLKDIPKEELLADQLKVKMSAIITNKRIAEGITQNDLAEKLGISQAMISKYESGEYNFSLETIANICIALKIDPAALFKTVPKKSAEKTKWKSNIEIFSIPFQFSAYIDDNKLIRGAS